MLRRGPPPKPQVLGYSSHRPLFPSFALATKLCMLYSCSKTKITGQGSCQHHPLLSSLAVLRNCDTGPTPPAAGRRQRRRGDALGALSSFPARLLLLLARTSRRWPHGGARSRLVKPFFCLFHLDCALSFVSPIRLPLLHQQSPWKRWYKSRAGRGQARWSSGNAFVLFQDAEPSCMVVQGERHPGASFVGWKKFRNWWLLGSVGMQSSQLQEPLVTHSLFIPFQMQKERNPLALQ